MIFLAIVLSGKYGQIKDITLSHIFTKKTFEDTVEQEFQQKERSTDKMTI